MNPTWNGYALLCDLDGVIVSIHKKWVEPVEKIISNIKPDFDREAGTITLIFQKIGKSTKLMGRLTKGDHILNLLGPLGVPVKIEKWGTVAVLGGGCGVAPVLPKQILL